MAFSALVTFACFVWPTPWTHSRFLPGDTVILPANGAAGLDAVPLTEFRQNRFTGEEETEIKGDWYAYACGIDTCWGEKDGQEFFISIRGQ